MRKFASIPPRVWQADLKAVRGDLEALCVHYHLTTSSHANMLGLYYLPLAYLAHEIGCPLEGASKGLFSLVREKICSYDHDRELVWVHEMASDQIATELSPKDKRVKGIADQLSSLPICPITLNFYRKYRNAFHLYDERSLCGFEAGIDGDEASPLEGASKALRSKEKEKEQEKDLGQGEGQPGSGKGGMYTPYKIPSSAAEGKAFLTELGVPPAKMDAYLKRLLAGDLSFFDIEDIVPKRGAA